MKLPLYHHGKHRVVIWHTELFETLDKIHKVEVRYSRVKDDGELGDRKSKILSAHEFINHFELQPDTVELGWNRIVRGANRLTQLMRSCC